MTKFGILRPVLGEERMQLIFLLLFSLSILWSNVSCLTITQLEYGVWPSSLSPPCFFFPRHLVSHSIEIAHHFCSLSSLPHCWTVIDFHLYEWSLSSFVPSLKIDPFPCCQWMTMPSSTSSSSTVDNRTFKQRKSFGKWFVPVLRLHLHLFGCCCSNTERRSGWHPKQIPEQWVSRSFQRW